jgi:sulfoxide reductase heme-binding subunit YedZ
MAGPSPSRRRMTWPWQDRRGRFMPLKAAVFALVFLPGASILLRIIQHNLGAEPYNMVIHLIGLWTVRLLLVTLAITAFQRLFIWPQLVLVRRTLGVATAIYALLHLVAYMVDQSLDWLKIATEITTRIYLIIGLAALIGVVALAVTSTDAMVRRLGAGWTWLHRLIYPIALLAVVHFFMQSKLDVTEPTWMAGLFGWVLAYRLVRWPVWALAPLSLVIAGLTALGEAVYFHLKVGAPIDLVLQANLSLDTGLRPAAIVLFVGLAVTGLATAWRLRPAGVRLGWLAGRAPH